MKGHYRDTELSTEEVKRSIAHQEIEFIVIHQIKKEYDINIAARLIPSTPWLHLQLIQVKITQSYGTICN